MIVTTTTIEGHAITACKGIVVGEVIMGANLVGVALDHEVVGQSIVPASGQAVVIA